VVKIEKVMIIRHKLHSKKKEFGNLSKPRERNTHVKVD
jgi:hypothetical protein